MKTKKLLITLSMVVPTILSYANWTPMKGDFESDFGHEWYFGCNDDSAYGDEEPPMCEGLGIHNIIEDPIAGGGNHVGEFRAAELNAEVQGGGFAMDLFPQEVGLDYNGLFTIYFRFAIEDFRQDTVFGTAYTDVSDERLAERYGGYVAGLRVNTNQGGKLEAHNDGYKVIMDEALANSTWYDIWIVHNNEHDLDTYPETALTYNVYIQGGAFAEQTRLVENGYYRQTEGAVRSFVVRQSTGGTNPYGNSALYLDDIYIDYTGSNLSVPDPNGGDLWRNVLEKNDGWVSTGAGYFGWLAVAQDPWFYSLSMKDWIYMPGTTFNTTGTTWAYFLNRGEIVSGDNGWSWSVALNTWVYVPSTGTAGWMLVLNTGS